MFNHNIRDRESIVYGRYKHVFMTSLFTATHFDWIDLWVCVNDIVVVWQSKFTHSLLENQHIVFVLCMVVFISFFQIACLFYSYSDKHWLRVHSFYSLFHANHFWVVIGFYYVYLFFFFSHFILFCEWTVHCLHYIIILSFNKISKCSWLITRLFCRFISLVISKMLK